MRGQLATIFALIILLAIPASSRAFYSLDEINEYLSYDRLKVDSQIVEGRLIEGWS